jgi:hypothetical protein
MSEVSSEVKTSIKRPATKKVATKDLTEVAKEIVTHSVEVAANAAKKVKLPKKAAEASTSTAAPVAEGSSTAEAVPAPAGKKASKSTAAHTDRIIAFIEAEFKIDHKTLVAALTKSELLQSSSTFRKTKKRVKEEGQPKRALSSYLIFANEHRQSVREQNPALSFKEVNTRLGDMWGAMTVDQKKKYIDLSNNDKGRYSSAMVKFREEHPLPAEPAKAQRAVKDHSADPNYILNPSNGQWVKRTSKTGKELVAGTATAATA